MPATPRKARALALALAGLGITASTMSAMPATAATGGSTSDDASTTTTAKKTQKKQSHLYDGLARSYCLALRLAGARQTANAPKIQGRVAAAPRSRPWRHGLTYCCGR